jgi:hypothetical protein
VQQDVLISPKPRSIHVQFAAKLATLVLYNRDAAVGAMTIQSICVRAREVLVKQRGRTDFARRTFDSELAGAGARVRA